MTIEIAGTADGGIDLDSDDLDDLVDRLSNAGPDGSRTILPEAQAEAYVARDVLGLSRAESSERLDVGVSAVDDRLYRARDNVEALAATARVLFDLGALSIVSSAQFAQNAPRADTADETTEDTSESSDATSGPWGRLMAIESVGRVVRPGNGVAVFLDDADDEDVEEVRRILTEDLGLVEFGSDSFEGRRSGTLRGRYPNAEKDADEEFPAPRELAADLTSATRRSQNAVTRVESDSPEETTEDTDEDEDVDEALICDDCGFVANSAGGLGGHRKYCEARRERLDREQAGVETLTGIGPKKAEALRSNGFETVLDVAHGNPARGMMKSDVLGGKVLVRAWNEARERLGLADVEPGTEE